MKGRILIVAGWAALAGSCAGEPGRLPRYSVLPEKGALGLLERLPLRTAGIQTDDVYLEIEPYPRFELGGRAKDLPTMKAFEASLRGSASLAGVGVEWGFFPRNSAAFAFDLMGRPVPRDAAPRIRHLSSDQVPGAADLLRAIGTLDPKGTIVPRLSIRLQRELLREDAWSVRIYDMEFDAAGSLDVDLAAMLAALVVIERKDPIVRATAARFRLEKGFVRRAELRVNVYRPPSGFVGK